jgi:hypothetical protein
MDSAHPAVRTQAAAHAITPAPSPEEAAAIMAAVGQFMRATAPPQVPAELAQDRWREEALLEGVQRDDAHTALSNPWINT